MMGELRALSLRLVRIPKGTRHTAAVFVDLEGHIVPICCTLDPLLIHSGSSYRWQKNKVLVSSDLTIDVFVIVPVKSGDALLVA